MTWLKPEDFPLPDPAAGMADYMLAYDVKSNLRGAAFNFLAVTPDPQFANPQAYLEGLLNEAFNLTQNNFAVKYASPNWSPAKAAFAIYAKAIAFLKQIPVNAGDTNSASVYDAWVAGKGALYGGHDPISVVPGTTGDGINAETGPDAVQQGSIFGGNKPK